jgi:predicted RNase H-like nuclease (RuvC/YqgF family)
MDKCPYCLANLNAAGNCMNPDCNLQDKISAFPQICREYERRIRELMLRIEELEAENKRLKSRGIEDMQHQIKELEVELKQLRLLVYSPDMENDDD